jgi:type II secretory pathway pseudopilin PulG
VQASRSSAAVSPGFTLVELMLAMALSIVLLGIAIPIGGDALDDMRTRAAARYLAGRIANSRLGAVNQSRAIGIRFVAAIPDYQFTSYVDGNGNGVRTADIQDGTDVAIEVPRQLGADFRGVAFGLMLGIADVDGAANTNPDGVRIGTAKILTMTPDGAATSGTLYVRGAHAQYAVRVLGVTGRTRVLKYEPGSRSWVSS